MEEPDGLVRTCPTVDEEEEGVEEAGERVIRKRKSLPAQRVECATTTRVRMTKRRDLPWISETLGLSNEEDILQFPGKRYNFYTRGV
jgi:hypothetical protein